MNKDFNDFRFDGLNYRVKSNKYYTMNRVSEDETKIVVKVADSHLLRTQYGFGLILDATHVVWLKDWQVSQNYFGNEVLISKQYFNVKKFGDFEEFDNDEENCKYESWLKVAKEQSGVDDDGMLKNPVSWSK